jgi:hypothetical protein
MLVVPFSSPKIVNHQISKLNGKFQENETLIFRSRIMISSLHLDPTFLQDSFLDSLILYFHQEYLSHVNSFKQSHVSNCMYYDRIANWLEYSYKKNVQGNGKTMLALFLNDDDKGKYDIFFSFFDILPFFLVIFYFVSIAGLELL